MKAELVDSSAGVLEFIPETAHYVGMHLGPPVRTHCRCSGHVQHRLQAAGDIDIVPLGCPVRWEDEGSTSLIVVHVHPSLLKSTALQMGARAEYIDLEPHLQVRDPRLQHICWAIAAELHDDVSSSRLYGESLARALATHLVRSYLKREPETAPHLSRAQLQKILDYIGSNLNGDASIAALSGVAGVSQSHFKALFKRTLGVPVHQYVVQRRVDAAVQMLATGTPASVVASRTGFADQSHMARWMRRLLGTTPRGIPR